MPIVPSHFEPRHCQGLMRDFALGHNRCNIWASPGTGKTGAVYILFLLLQLLGSQFFPVLVLAPKKVAINVWARERAKWLQFLGFRVVVLAGREDAFDRIEQLRRPADFYIINYDLVPWLVDYFANKGIEWPFKAVIADEATKLRGFRLRNGGVRATALARIAKYVGRWINLTGTPRPKDLLDLWGPMWFIDRGERLERTFGAYKKKYFDEDVYAKKTTLKAGALEQIAAKIRDVTITIKAEDYFDLPPIITNKVIVQLAPAAMVKYRQMEATMYAELNGQPVEAPNSAVMTMKCLQMASGAVYTDTETRAYEEFDSSKLEALDSILEEADGPVLVAYHWKFDVTRIKKAFPHAREIKSEKDIDDWNAGKIDLGLIHPGSAGHGIDLAIGGNIIVFYSQWWDLEMFMQVIERIGPTRQAQHGLNRPVFLHFLIAEGTLDEAVVARRESRRVEQDDLMDRMKR
jgi:SNF2 family DNA or RNA helicase